MYISSLYFLRLRDSQGLQRAWTFPFLPNRTRCEVDFSILRGRETLSIALCVIHLHAYVYVCIRVRFISRTIDGLSATHTCWTRGLSWPIDHLESIESSRFPSFARVNRSDTRADTTSRIAFASFAHFGNSLIVFQPNPRISFSRSLASLGR